MPTFLYPDEHDRCLQHLRTCQECANQVSKQFLLPISNNVPSIRDTPPVSDCSVEMKVTMWATLALLLVTIMVGLCRR